MEQDNNISNNNSGNGKNSRKFITALIILFVVAAGVYTYYIATGKIGNKSKERTVSSQLSKFEKQLKELPADASEEQRFNFFLKLSRAEYQLGNYEDALRWLNEFPEDKRNYQGVYYTYALIYRDMGNLEEARTNARLAVDNESSIPQRWQLLAEVSLDEGAEAVDAIFKEGLTATENDPELQASYDTWKASQAQ